MKLNKLIFATLIGLLSLGLLVMSASAQTATAPTIKLSLDDGALATARADNSKASDVTSKPAPDKSNEVVEQQLILLNEKMSRLEAIIEQQQKKIDELEQGRAQATSADSPALVSSVAGSSATSGSAAIGGGAKPPAPSDESPLTFHLGTATITPVGFAEFATIFRTTNTGNSIATNFGTIPYNNTVQGALTETRLTAQHSRFGLRFDARIHDADVIGYVETDFNGNDAANIFVSSNSHTNRLRHYWMDVRKGNFEFAAGQMWSLITPNRKGLSPLNDDVFNTVTIDPNYQVGLAWARQAGVRFIYHANDKVALGVAAENPQQYVGAGEVVFPFALNAALGVQFDAANNAGAPNLHPDIIGKVAIDSGRFHIEGAGMLRSFKAFSPINNTTSTKTGGAGALNLNVALTKNIHLLSNNFFSPPRGRYVLGLAPDVIVRPGPGGTAEVSLVNTYSTVQGFEARLHQQKALLYGYYGGMYARRNFVIDITNPLPGRFAGFGAPNSPNSANRAIQEVTLGLNYTFWKDPKWGAFQWGTQGSYVTRSPWFVAAGAPKNAHLTMFYFNLRYILPGKAPSKGK